MNWITNFVRPKLKSILPTQRDSSPDGLWSKCPECNAMLYHRELEHSQNVCPSCDHHLAIAPRKRFAHLFDAGAYREIEVPQPPLDPLNFRDQKKYSDRLRSARAKVGSNDAIVVAEGEILKTRFVAAAQDFDFMGGSMGMYVGNAIGAACDAAIKLSAPLVVFSAAGGARMQEGIFSLMQMPRTTVSLNRLKRGPKPLPYIVVLTNPTTGGVTASYAMLGDVQIAEPKALIGFAGPRVIEQTIREQLPEGFQRSEYLLEHGMLDKVVHRSRIREEVATIARLLMGMPEAVRGEITAQARPLASPA